MARKSTIPKATKKKCTKCGKAKVLKEFPKNRTRKCGQGLWCKACMKLYYQKNAKKIASQTKLYNQKNAKKIAKRKKFYNQKNAKKIAKGRKLYRQKNAKKIANQVKRYHQKNAKKIKLWEQKNAKEIAKRQKLWMQKNVKKVKLWKQKNAKKMAKQRKLYYQKNVKKIKLWRQKNVKKIKLWRQKNAKKLAKQQKLYRQNNPEKSRAVAATRRARKKGVNEKFTAAQRKFVRSFQKVCAICKRTSKEEKRITGKALAIDHWYPLSKGHALTMRNAVLMCRSCNSAKNKHHPKGVYKPAKIKSIEKKLREQVKAWEAKQGKVAKVAR